MLSRGVVTTAGIDTRSQPNKTREKPAERGFSTINLAALQRLSRQENCKDLTSTRQNRLGSQPKNAENTHQRDREW